MGREETRCEMHETRPNGAVQRLANSKVSLISPRDITPDNTTDNDGNDVAAVRREVIHILESELAAADAAQDIAAERAGRLRSYLRRARGIDKVGG